MASDVVVFTGHTVKGEPEFKARFIPGLDRPVVTLTLGDEHTTLHLHEPRHLLASAQVVADGLDLLTAALAGQDPLPAEPAALRA